MVQVSLDTSFLITLADPGRPRHAVAVEYFRHCVKEGITMWISTVAAGEFAVGQPFTDLPLQNFTILPYNLPHAIKAAELYKAIKGEAKEAGAPRPIILNDLKIIAQAVEENIAYILTEDKNTLSKMVELIRAQSLSSITVFLLEEGFTPGRFTSPLQGELSLSTETDESS